MNEFGFQRRPAMDFLDLLVSVDLLGGREGYGPGARYHNTEATAAFLDRNKPGYIGGVMELWDARNYRFWADITEGLRTGRAFPFDRYQTMTDVGGANALLSRLVAAKHPHLRCTSLDLPIVTEIASREIVEAGLADRVQAVGGDFFADPLPPADVITMGIILHDWNLERKRLLVKKAYDALPEGGAFVAVESFPQL